MLHYSQTLDNKSILGILRRTCGYVDGRLLDHGMRVSWLVARLLAQRGDAYTPTERRDICMLAVIHDIGAYKTEEIDHMVAFETGPVWAHAVYGSLFLKYFSPFSDLSDVVLFHHASATLLDTLSLPPKIREAAQFISLADRVDVLLNCAGLDLGGLDKHLRGQVDTQWSAEVLRLLGQVDGLTPTAEQLANDPILYGMLSTPTITLDEVDELFKMLIYIIDFRSRYTVTHTITTTSVSKSLAELMGMDELTVDLVVNGALLHDLGKVGIPVEILEFPGKLSIQAMAVMRTHVALTGEILDDCVTEAVKRVSMRHHEKLDGSGYPLGLRAKELTLAERVVAVADIVSALCGTRSYKDAFPKEKVLGIINQMSADGLIDSGIVAVTVAHFDEIMETVRTRTAPLLASYNAIAGEYTTLMNQYG